MKAMITMTREGNIIQRDLTDEQSDRLMEAMQQAQEMNIQDGDDCPVCRLMEQMGLAIPDHHSPGRMLRSSTRRNRRLPSEERRVRARALRKRKKRHRKKKGA